MQGSGSQLAKTYASTPERRQSPKTVTKVKSPHPITEVSLNEVNNQDMNKLPAEILKKVWSDLMDKIGSLDEKTRKIYFHGYNLVK